MILLRILIFLMAAAEVVWAAEPLTLADVARLLSDKNPKLQAEREAIASAKADRITADAFPNPKLSFNHQNPGGQSTLFTGSSSEQIGVDIPILIPGQRAARVQKADADIAAAQARVAATTGNLAAEACVSFIHLLALQQRVGVLSNSISEISRLRDKISGRAEQGAASAYDLARIEVEQGIVRSRIEAARSDLAGEASQLAALLNLTNNLPTAEGSLEAWTLPPQTLSDPESQIVSAPATIAANCEAAAALAGIKTAQRERWPEVSIGAGRAWTRHPYGEADYVGLNIEIPIFDTRRGQLEKARSEARAAEARRAAAYAETAAAIHQLAETVQRRQAALDHYRADVEPKLARLKEMSTDAYLLGRHTLLELLDAEQTRREVLLEEIETANALIDSQIHLLAATGRLPSFLDANRK